MTTRIIAIVTILALLNAVIGCSRTVLVHPNVLKKIPEQINILEAHLTSGEIMVFEKPGGVLMAEEQIVRGSIRDRLSQIKTVEIEEEDIQYVKIAKSEKRTSDTCLIAGCGLIAVLFIIGIVGDMIWEGGF